MNDRERYEQFLLNKRVCLVGPSPSVKDIDGSYHNSKEEQLSKIESYDVIVRLNRSLPMPKSLAEYVSRRTDVLYNCMSTDPESGGFMDIEFLKDKVSWIVSSLPEKPPFIGDIHNFRNRNNNTINFTTVKLEDFNQIEKEIKTRPNTGFAAISDILSCNIKELYITGITFFRGGYVKEYRNYTEEQVLSRMAAHGNHHQEPQLEYMKRLLPNDPRVVMDKHLKDIIDE